MCYKLNWNHCATFFEKNSASIAALSALLAFFFSMFVYHQTRLQLAPFERPILSMIFSHAQYSIAEKEGHVTLAFENIGKHPASNLEMWIGASPMDQPEQFKKIDDSNSANRITPRGIYAQQVSLQQFGDRNIFVYVLLKYEDPFKLGDPFYDELWLSSQGSSSKDIYSLTVQRKTEFEPYVTQVFPLRKRIGP